VTRRTVFDTSVVVSALLFRTGRLTWLRSHWADRRCVSLVSHETAEELARVLRLKKFRLTTGEYHEALAAYLPYCEIVDITRKCSVVCRDAKDQPFLDLAQSGKADLLVSGDRDLLVLAGRTKFLIESPEDYRRTVLES
jgi:putative PIN family toxin of toxin-antitoxin system